MRGTILFVDDDLYILEGLERGFRAAGFLTLRAQNVDQALRVLEGQPVDVIVTDEQMPGVCGSELLTYAQRRYPGVIRILLTGKGTSQSVQHAVGDAGAYCYLQKPCPGMQLLKVVQESLAARAGCGDKRQ